MGAARAYSYHYDYYADNAERAPEQAPSRRPDINVIPGGRTAGRASAQDAPLSAGAKAAAKVALAAIVLVFAVCLLSVFISAATMELSVDNESLSAAIAEEQVDASYLEVSVTTLASSSRLKEEAAELGMVEAESVETIVVATDVVVCDDAGNLSLSLSIAQAAALAG